MEGVDPIVCVNKPSHSAPVWLNSTNERCLWLGLAGTALITAKPLNKHTLRHTHIYTQTNIQSPQPHTLSGGGGLGRMRGVINEGEKERVLVNESVMEVLQESGHNLSSRGQAAAPLTRTLTAVEAKH